MLGLFLPTRAASLVYPSRFSATAVVSLEGSAGESIYSH
jgi:hypothetical protein